MDTRVLALKSELESWKQHDFERSMSDDFWYSNGGHAQAVREIKKIEAQLQALEAVAA